MKKRIRQCTPLFITISILLLVTSCSTIPTAISPTPSPSGTLESALPSATPSPLNEISPIIVTPIDSAGETYYAIKGDGRLFGWGRSESYTIGGGDETVSYEMPNEIMTGVKYVSGGQWVTLFIDLENTLWGIGNDYYGQLGDVTENRYEPIKLMENVVCASSSTFHCLALKDDGSLWSWGMYRSGIPGDSIDYENQERYGPEKIMDEVIYAVAVRDGGYAIKSDHSLWEWGMASTSLVKVMDDVQFVQDGMAIKTNNDLVTWSYDEDGQRTEPELLLKNVSCCDTGAAVQKDGSLWVWGDNRFGQLGDGTREDRAAPQKMMDDVVFVARGSHYTIAVKSDGSLWQAGSTEIEAVTDTGPYKIGEDVWIPAK